MLPSINREKITVEDLSRKVFDSYVHGQFSRRQFLGRVSKYAVGMMSAIATLDFLSPKHTFAQQAESEYLQLIEGHVADALLPIRLFGDPALRRQTTPIESVTPELQGLIADMIKTMHNADGIGLAAPQVGRLERLFVVDISPAMEYMPEDIRDSLPRQPMTLINPEIVWASDKTEKFEEGCLSIPYIGIPVLRPESVQVRYQDITMREYSHTVGGILARVIQHEYDHLEGTLITDHISSFQRTSLEKLAEISRGNVQTDYPVLSIYN